MKELWFDKYVEALNELEDEGITGPMAEDIAAKRAEQDSADYLADLADMAKERRKYGD